VVKIVICDDDAFMREMVESLVRTTGHDVLGIADTTAAAVGLIESGHPEAVVLDLSLGYNTDFDIIEAAISVGARAVVFTQNADAEILGQYSVKPTVVAKPDLAALEQVLIRLDRDEQSDAVVEEDRRHRPERVAAGPVPTGPSDAQAFFEAINGAQAGDALVALDVPVGAESVADEVGRRLRDTDRVLLTLPRAVRAFLPGGGEEGIASVLARIRSIPIVTSDCQVASVIVLDGEHGADAFDRLKAEGQLHPL
jgi:chemotaxis response regulator CheB